MEQKEEKKGTMAPAERKKVLLKQNCSLEKKPAKTDSKESKQKMSNKEEQMNNKGERRSLMSKKYEETVEAEKSSSSNNNTVSNNNIVSNNNNSSSRNDNNLMERACSEDRGLRRRPKVFINSFFFRWKEISAWFFSMFSLERESSLVELEQGAAW